MLLELNPQSSGRAGSRQWQVPQIAATVIRAAGYSPRRSVEHGPALRPGGTNMQSPLRGNGQDASKVLSRVDAQSQLPASQSGTQSGTSTCMYQPTNPAQGSLAGPRIGEAGQPLQPPQGSPASLRGGSPDPPPVCQGADAPAGGTCPRPQAVSSTAQSPPSQGSSRTSPRQGQQGTAVRQLGDGADDKSAPAQVESRAIWLHATRSAFCHLIAFCHVAFCHMSLLRAAFAMSIGTLGLQ